MRGKFEDKINESLQTEEHYCILLRPNRRRRSVQREPHTSDFNSSCGYQAPFQFYSSQNPPATITKPFRKCIRTLNSLSFETNLCLTIDRKQ